MKKNYGKRTDHPVRQIADGIYNISDFGVTDCYLILGKEKALLLDVGTGFGDLRSVVEGLTDLPVMVVCTHSHTDHLGGKGQFPEVYVQKDDITPFTGFMTSVPVRRAFGMASTGVLTPGVTFRDVQCGPYRTKLIPLSDEGSFDLGERTVRYKHMPGHTNGSIVLWDDKTKTFFAGDNMCACPWLFLANAAPVEAWLQTAKFILKQADDYTVYWSHEGGLLKKELMERVVELGEEVVAKYGHGFQFPRIKFYPCNDRVNGSIAFRTRNVKK